MNIEAWSAFCGRIEANLRTPHNVPAPPSPAESLPPPPPPRNVTPNISQNQKRIQCLADAFVCVSKLVVAQAAQIRVRFRIQSRIRFLLAVHLAEMCGKHRIRNRITKSDTGFAEIGCMGCSGVAPSKLDVFFLASVGREEMHCAVCICRRIEGTRITAVVVAAAMDRVAQCGSCRRIEGEADRRCRCRRRRRRDICCNVCVLQGGIEGETHRVAVVVVVAAVAVSSPLFVPRFVPTWFVAVRCAAVVVRLPRCLFCCVSFRCGLWRRHVVFVAFPCQSGVSFRHGLLRGGAVWGSYLVTLVVALLIVIVVWFVLMS